jgi:hypothetical protein
MRTTGRDDEKTKDGTEERKRKQQLYGLNPRREHQRGSKERER